MNLKSLNHSVFQLEYHIVWATKGRSKIFDIDLLSQIESNCRKFFLTNFQELISVSMQSDHIHILASISPKICLSSFIGILKSYLRRETSYNCPPFQRGYFISSVGIDDNVIKNYIASQ
jgi:putative transposase